MKQLGYVFTETGGWIIDAESKEKTHVERSANNYFMDFCVNVLSEGDVVDNVYVDGLYINVVDVNSDGWTRFDGGRNLCKKKKSGFTRPSKC